MVVRRDNSKRISKKQGVRKSSYRNTGQRARKSNSAGSRFSFSSRSFFLAVFGAIFTLVILVCFINWFFIDSNSFRWSVSSKKTIFPEGYNVRGLDISHYQSDINWSLLRNARIHDDPLSFVFIKATEGTTIFDENFNENFYQAKKNNILRGAYHFFVPDANAVKQAQFFLHQVHLEAGDLPPVLDVEILGRQSPKQLRDNVKVWMKIVEKKYGVKPILYTGYKFKLTYLNDNEINEYPYWIAHYNVDSLRYRGVWSFWQYTDRGQVNGITGDVDCNIFNGSLQQLNDLCIPDDADPE